MSLNCVKFLTSISEMRKIHDKCTSVLLFLPDATMSWQGNEHDAHANTDRRQLYSGMVQQEWIFKEPQSGLESACLQDADWVLRIAGGLCDGSEKGFSVEKSPDNLGWVTLSFSTSRNATGPYGVPKSDHVQNTLGSPWIMGLHFLWLV